MDKDIDDIVNVYDTHISEELTTLLEKISNGEKSSNNYASVFSCYKNLQKNNEYKKELEIYSQLTIETAMDEIENNTELFDAYCNLAYIYNEYKKDFQKALVCVNKAINIAPDTCGAFILRSEIHKNLKQKKLAHDDLAKAAKLEPDIAEDILFLEKSHSFKIKNSKGDYILAAFCIAGMLFLLLYDAMFPYTIKTNEYKITDLKHYYKAINTCNDSTYDTNLYNNQYCSKNYWAGAQLACEKRGMKLPSMNDYKIIYDNNYYRIKEKRIFYWSSDEQNSNSAKSFTLRCGIEYPGGDNKNYKNRALCVQKS